MNLPARVCLNRLPVLLVHWRFHILLNRPQAKRHIGRHSICCFLCHWLVKTEEAMEGWPFPGQHAHRGQHNQLTGWVPCALAGSQGAAEET
jgi:hypothetical protein